ncbi:MAG: sugar phosphate isomerase/epimerase [Clostridia bacterium]|nr:sugar phosphate isomerase/epimerase [Clostridia bacterium]
MSRLIASTMTHSTYTLEGALKKLKEAGFEKVEICSAGELAPHLDVQNATLESISHTARIIRESGMDVHCMNIGGDYSINQMEYVYALAEMVGAKIITYSCGCEKEGVSKDDRLKEVTDFNSKLANLGDKYGVICSIEAPHKNSLASNTEQVDKYWSMQDPRVKLTFDTAHLTYCGEDMLSLAKKHVSRMVHSHLRDAEKGNSLMRYGEGIVDFDAYFRILKEGNYTGYFSMEYPSSSAEDASDKLEKSIKFLSQFNI